MKHGRIKLWLNKLLMYGAAGSGKTSTKEWILGNDPPDDRTSTPLAMRPTTICRVNFDGDEFTKIGTLQERKVFLARALQPAKADQIPQAKQDKSAALKLTPRADPSEIKSTVHESSGEGKPLPLDDQPPSSVEEQPEADDVMSDEEIESKVDVIIEHISMDEELVKLMDHLSTNVHPRACFKLIQMIDCGGQSQFHEVLPIFMRKLSFYMFVFRLCDELATHPVVEFFADGKKFGSPFVSPQSVEQLLQHCVRAIHSRTLSTASSRDDSHTESSSCDPKSNAPELSKIMIVGTHLDQVEKSTESLDEKNKKIFEILSPLAKEQVIYHNLSETKVVFPINAKAPGKSEEEIVKQVREALLSDLSTEPVEIPSKWFALEILLEEMTEALQRGVLSVDDCITAAVEKLHFEEYAVESALQYLYQLSVLFYYPEILPNVVFVKPQVIIDKISELVFKSAEIEKLSEEHALSGEWKEFHEWALVTIKFLSKEFSSHYVPGLFDVKDLEKLFKRLLIFATFSETHLFVPSLLRHLDNKEVDKHRSTTIPSLVLQFPDGAPRQGIFCNLICWLVSSENDSPAPWSIAKVDNDKPKCLYRNCVQFKYPNSSAIITLIDTYLHFEVHVYIPPKRVDNLCPKILPKARSAVFKGIRRAAVNTGNFDSPRPTPALICPCGKGDTHIATADPELGCTCTRDIEEGGDLTPHQLLWIVAPSEPKCLTESNFCELYSELKEHASKWRDIGTFLQFQQGELDNIQHRPFLLQTAPESWLGAMLTDWLRRGPNDNRGGPSIENLKLALQKSALGAVSFDIK